MKCQCIDLQKIKSCNNYSYTTIDTMIIQTHSWLPLKTEDLEERCIKYW